METDELSDPTFGDASQTHKRANVQAAILRDFQTRWRHEYLTSLREHHRTSGTNVQSVKNGDVVIVHDDTPRMMWKLAVIEELIVGRDGLTRAAMIKTANGTTSRPIAKLYPLELASGQGNHTVEVNENSGTLDSDSGPTSEGRRPSRAAARRATDKVKEWARILVAPRRMS